MQGLRVKKSGREGRRKRGRNKPGGREGKGEIREGVEWGKKGEKEDMLGEKGEEE